MLNSGETAEDVDWLLQRDVTDSFGEKGLSAKPLRLLIARLESLGGICSEDDVSSVLKSTVNAGNTAFASAFLECTKAPQNTSTKP